MSFYNITPPPDNKIDSTLSYTSTNPVQNNVIKKALNTMVPIASNGTNITRGKNKVVISTIGDTTLSLQSVYNNKTYTGNYSGHDVTVENASNDGYTKLFESALLNFSSDGKSYNGIYIGTNHNTDNIYLMRRGPKDSQKTIKMLATEDYVKSAIPAVTVSGNTISFGNVKIGVD